VGVKRLPTLCLNGKTVEQWLSSEEALVKKEGMHFLKNEDNDAGQS